MTLSRRSVLWAGAAGVAGSAFAGCLSEPGGREGEGGYAAFFALADWAGQITGDEMEIENPVETGEMGHGWDPPADIERDIAGSKAFVYMDTNEFAWAQDVAANLEEEYDVALIDALEGLDHRLLPLDRGAEDDRDPEDGYDVDPDAFELSNEGYDLYDRRTGENAAYWHDDHWHGGVPDVPEGESVVLEAVVEDADGRVVPLGEDDRYGVDARIAEGQDEDPVAIESTGDRIEFDGEAIGDTRVVFEVVADGEVVWDSRDDPSHVAVVEDLEESEAPEVYDPHVWADPVIARDVVETIATELGEVDPDNADLYRENAREYAERLDDVHRQFEEVASNATRDVAVFAGHDSFQYVEERYDFELRTPTGVDPDGDVTFDDVTDLTDAIEEHDIDTILYDPFETSNPDDDVPEMVDVLIDEADLEPDAHAPITPAEGTTDEWSERGYGWVEQMEEITIPSLATALGAE